MAETASIQSLIYSLKADTLNKASYSLIQADNATEGIKYQTEQIEAVNSQKNIDAKLVSINRIRQAKENIKRQQEQYELERARQVYKTYQDNIKAAGTLREEILKGLKAGQETTALFLKACCLISNITGDTLFYRQVSADLQELNKKQ